MSNLVEIPKAPEKSVIEILEKALEMAKAGDLVSVAIAGNMTLRRTYVTFSSDFNCMSLLGAVRVLERELMDCRVDLICHPADENY